MDYRTIKIIDLAQMIQNLSDDAKKHIRDTFDSEYRPCDADLPLVDADKVLANIDFEDDAWHLPESVIDEASFFQACISHMLRDGKFYINLRS
jgi:hypothetical protein